MIQNNIFKFETKAKNLESISKLLSSSLVPKFIFFELEEWFESDEKVLSKIQSFFGDAKIIVRSSAQGEDSDRESMAGCFESVSNIFANDLLMLKNAINTVLHSYEKSKYGLDKKHQILVQLMVEKVSMSGVILTQDLNSGAPYYVINYDDQSGSTDTVTAGKEHGSHTLLIHRDNVNDLKSPRFSSLLKVVKEIEQLIQQDCLDIEFAVDKENIVYILQIRPISTRPNWNNVAADKVNEAIGALKNFLVEYQDQSIGIYGEKSIFTTMSDWNPAEMIGVSPRPLALSLYKHLITDYAWREARRSMGYFEPRGKRLMVDLCGKPYIDVRLSFNSFLPAKINSPIADKLVNAWLARLSQHKELHDKVEFEIVTTAMSFDFDSLVKKQFNDVLSASEMAIYRKELFELTNNLISGKVAPIIGELNKIADLLTRRLELLEKNKNSDIASVSALLEDCIKLGTIPFSILARHAFIATSFLRSMVSRDVLTDLEAASFQKSIKTIAGDFITDIDSISENNNAKDSAFMQKYGHLRPGTYDILSRRYDQREDMLSGNRKLKNKNSEQNSFNFSDLQLQKMDSLLMEFGYEVSSLELIDYIKSAVSAREYAKFVFSKNISDSLEIIANWGEKNGLNREDLSYLSITDILDSINCCQILTLPNKLKILSLQRKSDYEVTTSIRLPYIIESERDVSIIPLLINKPNFITKKSIRAEVIFINGQSSDLSKLDGKIVLIEGADPGFDWIFSRQIVGLITKFGGANSHMAIRCAEFGLPAAIGCGEQIFDRVVLSSFVELDCSEERVESIEI